jgi:hypothetical protein
MLHLRENTLITSQATSSARCELEAESNDKLSLTSLSFVMAVNSIAANNRAPVFLRSYVNSQNPSDVPNIKVWEAARATSAAPAYFLPMKVGEYMLLAGW